MRRNEPIRNVMSKAPKSIQKGEPLSKARKMLSEGGFHHLPVVDGERVVGMLSSKDLLNLSFDFEGIDPRGLDAILDHQFSIESVMNPNVVSIPKDSMVRDAAEVLANGTFHSVLVTDEKQRLAGIVTSTDMIRYLVSQY